MNKAIQDIPLDRTFFQGVISVEHVNGTLRPWRLPHEQRDLFPSPDGGLLRTAQCTSGCRLRFETTSRNVLLQVDPLPVIPAVCLRDTFVLDATIDGEIVVSATPSPGDEEIQFVNLPDGQKVLEIWLPPEVPVSIRGIAIDADAEYSVVPDHRPKWITYGSSLTHCVRAKGSSRTWPAILARKHDFNLISLGYGGQCHLEPMLGMMIRDLPADIITLKLGINTIGGSLNARTFPAAVIGLVRIIREKHPTIPIALISPIGFPPNETKPNVVNYTIQSMRDAIADVHQRLVAAGDENFYYANGLDVFSVAEIGEYTVDQCHPNGDGIELMADHFDKVVLSQLIR